MKYFLPSLQVKGAGRRGPHRQRVRGLGSGSAVSLSHPSVLAPPWTLRFLTPASWGCLSPCGWGLVRGSRWELGTCLHTETSPIRAEQEIPARGPGASGTHSCRGKYILC